MQRAYDQNIHDVALMNLPVTFCLDRAGLVGEDGPTHHGVFDISFLRAIPNLVSMAPKDEAELHWMMKFTGTLSGPSAIRYPRGSGSGVGQCQLHQPIVLGRAEVCREGKQLAILALGSLISPALEAAEELARKGIDAMVINPRFIKPLDTSLLESLFRRGLPLVTAEEGCLMGGFGASILEVASEMGFTPAVLRLGIPDAFVPQGSLAELRAMLGLDAAGILLRVQEWMQQRQLAASAC